jgi:D-alanyl-D-alanine carboxypeptidase/D-alanyl-D-alanine-endopeptidase (penicillin-binding protein 4)
VTAPEPASPRSSLAIDPLLLIAVAAGAIAFLLFAIWRWTDAKADGPSPLPNASTSSPPPLPVPVLSARRVPTAAERDLSVASFRTTLQPLATDVATKGCVAVSVDGSPVVAANADAPLIPASNQKLLTVAAALDVLGADHTFTTELRGAATGGVVAGDVYLVGGGDPVLQTDGYPGIDHPTIGPTRFDALAEQLVAAGVTSITGNVIAVDDRYDDERFPPGWSSGIRSGEAGPIGALVVDDDIFGGTKPTDPALAAADELVRQLRAAGISVGGSAHGTTAPEGPALASVQSAPLSSIVADVLTNSHDNAAEMLLKELGTTVATPGTRVNGIAVVQGALDRWGIARTGTVINDGSGLDRTDLATCDVLLGVLVREASNPAFTDAFATLGQTGSLDDSRLSGFPLTGVLRAKTGTLTDVKALSGYVPLASGGRIEFSMLLNTPGIDSGSNVVPTWRQLAEALATYPSGPTAAQLAPY